jgi:hypothetical protein
VTFRQSTRARKYRRIATRMGLDSPKYRLHTAKCSG